MSTNARIALKLSDKTFVSVYHHWDGYPEWLGVVLTEQYNKLESVIELLSGGDMSSCWSDNQYDEEKQEYVKNDPKPDLEIDEAHKEHLKELGLWEEDSYDGSEFIDKL